MPLVTSAPILIDATNFSRQFNPQIDPFGIFQVGGTLYQVLLYQLVGNNDIGVYASTDSGATWVEQDAAHHPTLPGSNAGGKAVFFDAATGLIYILYYTTSGGHFVYLVNTFDTATNLYGTATGNSAGLTNETSSIYVQSGGVVVVPLAEGAPGSHTLKYMTVTGGVWAGPFALGAVSGNSLNILGVVPDSSDRGNLFYADASSHLVHAQISAAFALGAPTTLSATWDANDIDQIIWNSNVVVAWTENDILKVAIGTPLAAPVFTTYTVGSVAASGNLADPTLAIDKNGNLVVFVAWTDFSRSPYIDQLLMWTFDGVSSWGSSTLFYDEIANPPANSQPQLSQFIHTGAAIQLANGTWVYSTALETNQSGTAYCTGFVLVATSALAATSAANPGDGGKRVVVLAPNQFDFCLHREYRLFCNTDRELLGCARLPKCFTVDEREWGETG